MPSVVKKTKVVTAYGSHNNNDTIVMMNNVTIGVRTGGARGAAAPPNFGQLKFFGQQEKIWAKPVFKDFSMFI